MTREEIADLCRSLGEMAERVGCRFVPDPIKIEAILVRSKEPESGIQSPLP
jgi:hypothetical protein